MDNEKNFLLPVLYLGLASIAGAIVALSFRAFQNMRRVEILMALFTATAFGFFVGPWVTRIVFGSGPIDLQIQGGVFFGLSAGANVLIPALIKKLNAVLNAIFENKEPQA